MKKRKKQPLQQMTLPQVVYEVPPRAELELLWRANREIIRTGKESGVALISSILGNAAVLTRLSEAQNHRCCYCGCETNRLPDHPRQATREHVIPRSRGGTDDWENLAMACARHNRKRGNKVRSAEKIVQGMIAAP